MTWSVGNGGVAANGAVTTNATLAVTLGWTPADNSKLIAVICDDSAAARSITSVSDGTNSFGQIFHTVQSIGSGFDMTDIWVLDHPHYSAAPTITSVMSSTASYTMQVLEVSGLLSGQTSAILDTGTGSSIAIQNATTNTTAPDPTYGSSAANEFLLNILGDPFDGASNWTAPTGYSGSANNFVNPAADGSQAIAWKNSTGGSEAGSEWTWPSQAMTVTVVKVAFKLAAVPYAPSKPAISRQAIVRASRW